MLTTKNLYNLVVEEIEKRLTTSQKKSIASAGRSTLDAFALGGVAASSKEILSAVYQILQETLPPTIISGLDVDATSPASMKVTISSGRGCAGGRVYQLSEKVTVDVPRVADIYTWYVNLYDNKILVEQSQNTKISLTIAKIIIPKPAITARIVDKKDGSWDGYIQSFKEYKLYGKNSQLEEDTIELLRDNIGEILADNLIGNIRLSENLKVTNTSGSLELDSSSVKIYSSAGNVVAKFNRNGTFFYNDDGVEIAKFSTNEAQIGNISIGTSYIGSRNYISGNSGFRINDTGYAEFSDVKVRGRISSSVFEYDKVSAVGGKLLVANSTVLNSNVTSNAVQITVDTAVFGVGDILVLKIGNDQEYMEVLSQNGTTYTVIRDLAATYTTKPSWDKGTAIVALGKNGSSGEDLGGYIEMDATSTYAPFIDILYRNSGVYNDVSTKVRLGNLSGIIDAEFGALSGFGLYTDNAYIKGLIQASTICGTEICGSTVCGGTICGATIIGLILEAGICLTSPIICGGTMSATTICGVEICSSTMTASCIQTSTGNPRTVFDSYAFRSFDTTGKELVRICDGSITLCDADNLCNYTYLCAGRLRFHDQMGDVPYVKRMCSGIACTGSTIVLPGWTSSPKVVVGISSLQSYNSSCSGACQSWYVYSSTPECFCESGNYYGYCFTIHATLATSASWSASCLRDINFGTSYCTTNNTCQLCLRHRFQLWCNAACANYYYGCLCYNVCYRVVGAGSWCACSYTYTQAHASLEDMQTTCSIYMLVSMPCSACWEIMSCQTGLSWHDSGIGSGTTQCCLCSRGLSGVPTNLCCAAASVSGTCTSSSQVRCSTITIDGSDPSNVYCAYVCACACLKCAYGTATTGSVGSSSSGASSCLKLGPTQLFGGSAYAITNGGTKSNSYNCGASLYTCCRSMESLCCSSFTFCVYAGACHTCNQGSASALTCGCFLGGTFYQCYCLVSGTAGCCAYTNVYTTQDGLSTSCVLDPNGCLNWLAIGYD